MLWLFSSTCNSGCFPIESCTISSWLVFDNFSSKVWDVSLEIWLDVSCVTLASTDIALDCFSAVSVTISICGLLGVPFIASILVSLV